VERPAVPATVENAYAQKSQNGQRFVWICSRLDKMLQLKANQLINNNIT
jgi:hypothetical protein